MSALASLPLVRLLRLANRIMAHLVGTIHKNYVERWTFDFGRSWGAHSENNNKSSDLNTSRSGKKVCGADAVEN
jgi:hypothetical protein